MVRPQPTPQKDFTELGEFCVGDVILSSKEHRVAAMLHYGFEDEGVIADHLRMRKRQVQTIIYDLCRRYELGNKRGIARFYGAKVGVGLDSDLRELAVSPLAEKEAPVDQLAIDTRKHPALAPVVVTKGDRRGRKLQFTDEDIIGFHQEYTSDPETSIAKVADAHGISAQYLGTKFKLLRLPTKPKHNHKPTSVEQDPSSLKARIAKLFENSANYVPIFSHGKPMTKRLCPSPEVVGLAWAAYSEMPLEAVAQEFEVSADTLLRWFLDNTAMTSQEKQQLAASLQPEPQAEETAVLVQPPVVQPPIMPFEGPPALSADKLRTLWTYVAEMQRMGADVQLGGEVNLNIKIRFGEGGGNGQVN